VGGRVGIVTTREVTVVRCDDCVGVARKLEGGGEVRSTEMIAVWAVGWATGISEMYAISLQCTYMVDIDL
jgi:hypothetical protein